IKDVQSSLTDIIKNSKLEAKDKAKFLTTIKKIQTAEDFGKAIESIDTRINHLVNEATKRNLRNDIVKLQKNILESPSIAIDYKEKVKSLMKGFELRGRRESTLERLKATQEFLNSELE